MDSRSRSDKTQHKYDLPEPLESQPMKLCPTCQPRYECSHLGLEETPRWKLAVFWMTVLPVAWKALAFCTANPPKSCWKIDYDQLLSDMLEPDHILESLRARVSQSCIQGTVHPNLGILHANIFASLPKTHSHL
jgi:hypothetical protein